MQPEMWRWFWTGLAVILSVAEIFTAGFFMLPFGIGAGAAAVLAWVGAHVLVQWLAFLVISVASLVGLQRFVRRQDDLRMVREAQVVVRAHVQELAASRDLDVSALRGRHYELGLVRPRPPGVGKSFRKIRAQGAVHAVSLSTRPSS